jgi:hypothetical protein
MKVFNKWCCRNWVSACRELKLDPYLSPCTTINSKWVKDLTRRPETLKPVQERVGDTLECTRIGNNFRNTTPVAQQFRERIDKWESMELKSFCTTKEMVTRLKKQPTEWEKIFASYTFEKGLVSRISRGLKYLHSQRICTY